jgi:hypothetical protein
MFSNGDMEKQHLDQKKCSRKDWVQSTAMELVGSGSFAQHDALTSQC